MFSVDFSPSARYASQRRHTKPPQMVLFYVARVVIKRNLQIVSPRSRKKKKRRNHTKNQLMMMPMRRHRHHRASFCSLPPEFFPIHSSGCNKLINKLPSVSHGLCDASGTTNATTARSCGILLELGRSAVLSLLFLVSSSVGPGGPALSSHRWLSFYARG